jgi:hypothetical protein
MIRISEVLLIGIRFKETFGMETKPDVRRVARMVWLRIDGMKEWRRYLRRILELFCTILIVQLAELVCVKLLVSVLSELVLGRDIWEGLSFVDSVKRTLRRGGFLGAVRTDALPKGGLLGAVRTDALGAVFALLILACRSCSAFTCSAHLFRYLKYQTLQPQHAKPNAVRPPMMGAMASFPCIMEISGKMSPCLGAIGGF